MDPKKTGEVIQKARKDKGMTQKDLAEKLFISDKAVSKWERGLSYPDITVLLPLAKTLEVNIYDLLEGNIMEREHITQEQINEAMENTINYSTNQIKSKKKKYLIFSIIAIILIAAGALAFVQYDKHEAELQLKESIIKSDQMYQITEFTEYAHSIKDGTEDAAIKSEDLVAKLALKYPDPVFTIGDDAIKIEYNKSYSEVTEFFGGADIVNEKIVYDVYVLFAIIDDLDKVEFKFNDQTYTTDAATVKEVTGVDQLKDLQDTAKWKDVTSKLKDSTQLNETFSAMFK